MNSKIVTGKFSGVKKFYRSQDGRHYFNFEFKDGGGHIDVQCNNHPSLNGRDSSASKTHLFSSGKVCFAGGREPRTQAEAEARAKQWAEYLLEYRRTGRAQS